MYVTKNFREAHTYSCPHRCYTTRLTPQQRAKFKPEDLHVTPTETGDVVFVKETIREGILPRILTVLTNKRGAAKKLMAQFKGTDKEKIMDRRQNALKVTSNSVYGFTGAEQAGTLPCSDIAKAVTSTGRDGIMLTARMVEEPYGEILYEENETEEEYKLRCTKIRSEYPIARNENETEEEHAKRIKESVEIIYGDTDSVMVRMRGLKDPPGSPPVKSPAAAAAIALGKKYADWITKWFFKAPMVYTKKKS